MTHRETPVRDRKSLHWPRLAALVLVALVALVLVWPQALGAQRSFGFAQLVSFRVLIGMGLLLLAIVAAVVTVLRPRGRRAFAGAVAVLLAVAAGADGAVLLSRGWDLDSHSAVSESRALPQGDLVVLSWNLQGGATSADEVVRLVIESEADVVALPETDANTAARLVADLAEHGVAMSASTLDGQVPTSVLIDDRLGEYRWDRSAGSTPGLPSGVWLTMGATGSPPIVVAHPLPPLPWSMGAWREGLDWVDAQCDALGPEAVIVGDLNATVDHLWETAECRDAAAATGAAAWGTWPSTQPAWLAAPIDHVLVGRAWDPIAFRVVETGGAGSDHRPVIAVLDRH